MPRTLTIVLLAGLAAPAAAQEQLWIRQFGTWGHDSVFALCPDGAGGALVAGRTNGTLAGPYAGGSADAWLARYDSAGNRLWIRQFGSSGGDTAGALAPDGFAGAFVAGATSGSLGGPHQGLWDVWLAHYDSVGNQSWIRQFGTSNDDFSGALASDGSGGAFIAGWTRGSLGGPNPSASTHPWLARYDSAGNRLWIRQFGTSDGDFSEALAPDGSGGAFIAGGTSGSLGGPNQGLQDAWLARYDSAGNQSWIRQFGTSGTELARALAPDGSGGVFVAGPTSGSLGGSNQGGQDAWVARFDSAGNQLWIRQFGSSAGENADALAYDGSGGFFIAGSTAGSLGGPNQGIWDFWLARYDSAGNQSWIRQFGTSADDRANALAPDGTAGVFIGGGSGGSLGGPFAGGDYDAWLARWTGGPNPCYANCDGSTQLPILNIADFGCFLQKFAAGDSYANCDQSTTPPVLNVADFGCFLQKFAGGCQ